MGGYWGGISPAMRDKLDSALADANRGHRIHEWEGVATRLANVVRKIDETEPAPPGTPEGVDIRSYVLAGMQAQVTDWCERKGWKGEGSAPVTFGDTMALLHSEVSEALEAYRDHKLEDATLKLCSPTRAHLDGSVGPTGHVCKPEGVGSEFADILIRLLDDCDRFGIDLAAEFERKMAYNETRAFQHGGRVL